MSDNNIAASGITQALFTGPQGMPTLLNDTFIGVTCSECRAFIPFGSIDYSLNWLTHLEFHLKLEAKK